MYQPAKQQGAVLFIALIMLLVLTVLAISSMRGVTLDARISGNRAQMERSQHLADAALREAEFRFSPLVDINEIVGDSDTNRNCTKKNTLNNRGINKPCLLKTISDKDELTKFFTSPLTWLKNSDYPNNTGASSSNAANATDISWMPYHGLDYANSFEDTLAYWNLYYIESDAIEQGSAERGCGWHYYLANGQHNDEIAAQSIVKHYILCPN